MAHDTGDGTLEGSRDGTRSSDVMARLTLSALERASRTPGFWSEPEVHRALLVSGLSVLVSSLARLQADLG
jgi:hypothetical protein